MKKSQAAPAPAQATTNSQNVMYAVYLLLGAAAAFLAAQIIAPIIAAFFALTFGVKGNEFVRIVDKNDAARFGMIFAIELLTVWFITLLLKRRGWKWADIGLGRKPQWQDLRDGLKYYALYFLIYIGVFQLVQLSGLVDTDQAQQLGFENTHGPNLIFVFLSLAILPPIAEEILFRGYIFMGLRKRIRFIISLIITSVLFGAAHLEFGSGQPLNWAAGIDTLTLSCLLCYAAEKTKSLWPNMFVHAAKNVLAFILLFVIR